MKPRFGTKVLHSLYAHFANFRDLIFPLNSLRFGVTNTKARIHLNT